MGLVVYGIFDTRVSLHNAVQAPSSKVALPHCFVLSSPLPHTVVLCGPIGQALISPPLSVLGTCQAVLAPYTLTGLTWTQVARLFYRALDSYHTWTSMSA